MAKISQCGKLDKCHRQRYFWSQTNQLKGQIHFDIFDYLLKQNQTNRFLGNALNQIVRYSGTPLFGYKNLLWLWPESVVRRTWKMHYLLLKKSPLNGTCQGKSAQGSHGDRHFSQIECWCRARCRAFESNTFSLDKKGQETQSHYRMKKCK